MDQIRGTVVHGNGFGETLGFPTANVQIDKNSQRPSDGIYACWVRIGEEEKKWAGALHAGPRPAIGDSLPTIEVHILDFDGRDLYGQRVSLELVRRLRDVQNFASLDALAKEIGEDVERVRAELITSRLRSARRPLPS